MLLFFVRPYDISRFLRFRTICVIFRQISFLHIFVHGVYMKLDNISFSSPKIICVSRDITCGCPYDIHGIALLAHNRLNWARRTSSGWWDDWDDTVLQTQVWGQARYLSVTEAPHNIDFHTWMGKKHFCFLQTAETGNRTPNSGVKRSRANHYPMAPALSVVRRVGSFSIQWSKTCQQRLIAA